LRDREALNVILPRHSPALLEEVARSRALSPAETQHRTTEVIVKLLPQRTWLL
jgi:hypothetical protein